MSEWKPASELTGEPRWIWGAWGWYEDAVKAPVWWDGKAPGRVWVWTEPCVLPDMFAECEAPPLPAIGVRQAWRKAFRDARPAPVTHIWAQLAEADRGRPPIADRERGPVTLATGGTPGGDLPPPEKLSGCRPLVFEEWPWAS